MSIKTEPLTQAHIMALVARGVQKPHEWIVPSISKPGYAQMMAAAGPCAAFVDESGVLAIAGLIDFTGTDRCVIWIIFAGDVTAKFGTLYKRMKRAMKHFPRTRYEAHIDPSFKAARRLASISGFAREGLMRQYENGHDRELWALVGG